MTSNPFGQSYHCAPQPDQEVFSREDVSRLQAYLSELEDTISRLAEHIAELESHLHTLDNERQIAIVAEAEAQGDAASGNRGGQSPLGVRSMSRSSRATPVLFRFEPNNSSDHTPNETTKNTPSNSDPATNDMTPG